MFSQFSDFIYFYCIKSVLQSIANESIPGISQLGKGRGSNKIPVNALCFVFSCVVLFIIVGDINSLAPIVTITYLFTYGEINTFKISLEKKTILF